MRFRPIVLLFAVVIALLFPCVTAQFPFSVRALENSCQCDCCYSIGTRGRTECVSPTKTSFSVPSCSQCDVHQCAERFPTACSQPSSIVSTTCLAREGWMLRFVPYIFLVVTVLLILYGFFFKTFDGYHEQQPEPFNNRFQPAYQTFLPSYQSGSPRVHAASPPLLSTILEDEEQPTDVLRTATYPAATTSSANATDAFATSRDHVTVLMPPADTEQIDVPSAQSHQVHIVEYTPNNKESVSVTTSPRMLSGAPPVINKPDSANRAFVAQQTASHLVSPSARQQAVTEAVPHVHPAQKHPETDAQPQLEDDDVPDPFPTSQVAVAGQSVGMAHVGIDTASAASQTVDEPVKVSATPTGNKVSGDRESGAITNTPRDVTVPAVAETVSPVQGIETKQDEVVVSESDPSHEGVDEHIQDSFPLESSPVTEGMAPIEDSVPQTEENTEIDAVREESTPEDQTQGTHGNTPVVEAFERDAYLSGVKEVGVDVAEKSMHDETESGHSLQTHEAPGDGPSKENHETYAGTEDHSELPAEVKDEVQEGPLSSSDVVDELSEDPKAKDEAHIEEDGEPSDMTASEDKDAMLDASSSTKEIVPGHEELTPSDGLEHETVVENEALVDSKLMDKTNPAAESEPVNDISSATGTGLVEESSPSEEAKPTEGDTTTSELEPAEQPTPELERQTEDRTDQTKNEGSDVAGLGAVKESSSAGDVEPTDEAAGREGLETVEESHTTVDAAQNDKPSESIESTPVEEPSGVYETELDHAVSSETEMRGIGTAAAELHSFESPSVVSEADQIAEAQSQQLEEQRAVIVGTEPADELSVAAQPGPVAEQSAAVETEPEFRVSASGESEDEEETSVMAKVEPIDGTPVGDESAPVDDATSTSAAVESEVVHEIKAEEVHDSIVIAEMEPMNESFQSQPANETALVVESEPAEEEPSVVAELVQTAAASTETGSEPDKEEPAIVDAHPAEGLTAETESEQIEQPPTAVEGELTEEPSKEAELVPVEESPALAKVQQRVAASIETEPELVEEERAAVDTSPEEEPTAGAELEHTEESSAVIEGEPAEVASVAAELVPVEESTAVDETEAKAVASAETEAELAEDQYAATEPTLELEPADEAGAVAGESPIVDEQTDDSLVADESKTVRGPPEAVEAEPAEKDIAANESEPVEETPTAPECSEEGEVGDVEAGVTTATVFSEILEGAEPEDQPEVDGRKNSDAEVVETGDGEVAVATDVTWHQSETVTNLESVPALEVQDDSIGELLGDSEVAEEAGPEDETADTAESEDVANMISESNIVSDTDLDGNNAATLNTTEEAYPTESAKTVDIAEALTVEAFTGETEGETQVQVGDSTEATTTEPESHEQDDIRGQESQLMLDDSEYELVQSMTGDTLQRSESRQATSNLPSTDDIEERTSLEGTSEAQEATTGGQASASATTEHDTLLGTDATDAATDGVEAQTVETGITDRDEAISSTEVAATGDSLKLMEEDNDVGDTVGEQSADAAPQGSEVVMHGEDSAIGEDNDYPEDDNTGIDENTRCMGDSGNEEDTDMYDENGVVGGTERKDVPEDNVDAGDEGIAGEDSGRVGVVKSSPSAVDAETGDDKVAEE